MKENIKYTTNEQIQSGFSRRTRFHPVMSFSNSIETCIMGS